MEDIRAGAGETEDLWEETLVIMNGRWGAGTEGKDLGRNEGSLRE